MLGRAKREVVKGLAVEGFTIYAKGVQKGRFEEEADLDIYVKKGKEEEHLLFVKVFEGRKPVYRAWVEVFGITEYVKLGGQVIHYFDSALEDRLLRLFSDALGPGEKIYVEYYNDEETRKQLELGVPLPATRLGYKLFSLGLTWFKDWYFPEGFMEGGQKLQAEKPLDDRARRRQLSTIRERLEVFVGGAETSGVQKSYTVALKRAESILQDLR